MRKKIRVSLPKLIKDILDEDLKYFNLKMEKLCNLIIQEIGYEPTLRIHDKLKHDKKIPIHFNLNEKNTIFFQDMLRESEEYLETEYFRRLFSTYASFHPSIRERILKRNLFKELEYGMKNKFKIKIGLNKEVKNTTPLEIIIDDESKYNLLRVEESNDLNVLKIKEIVFIKIL